MLGASVHRGLGSEEDGDGDHETCGVVWRVLGLPMRVATHPGLWAIFGAHMAFNFGAYYMTDWNPSTFPFPKRAPSLSERLH